MNDTLWLFFCVTSFTWSIIRQWQEKSLGHTNEQADRLNSSKIGYIIIIIIIIVMYMLHRCDTISFYYQDKLEQRLMTSH